MTTHQLHLFNALYFVIFIAVAILSRAPVRRIFGAAAGASIAGVVALAVVAFGEQIGWWHMVIAWEPYFLVVLWIDFALGGFVFLITWRIARRFGGRGLAAVALVAAVLGPVRDYQYLKQFPEWGTYASGVAPVLAVSATYLLLGVLGHGVMRLVAGPASEDRLALRPWTAS
jgi:hypothetical protein